MKKTISFLNLVTTASLLASVNTPAKSEYLPFSKGYGYNSATEQPNVSVEPTAKSITVRILGAGASGSGTLIRRRGSTYYVATAWHVIANNGEKEEISIITPDGIVHTTYGSSATQADNYDVGTIAFESKNDYQIAVLASDISNLNRNLHTFSTEGDAIGIAGYPIADDQVKYTKGVLVAYADMDIGRGYEFIYTNNTTPGMSGGPILNREGQLIGIHGRGERDQVAIKERGLSENTKTAVNQGIPISYIEPNIKSGPIDEQETKIYLATIKRAARHWGREQIALKMINKLITKDPSSKAFYVRGRIKIDLEKSDSAIEDFRKSLTIDPTNHYAMYSLGYTLYKNGEFDESIEIITKLIQAKPEAKFIQLSSIVVADILNVEGKYDYAAELAEGAIQIDPKQDNGYLALGRIYRKQKRYNDAIEAYKRCPRKTAQLLAESAYTYLMIKDGEQKAWSEINLAIRMHEMFGAKADMARLDKPSSAYAFRALLNTFQGKCSKAKLDILKAQSLNKLNQKVKLVHDMYRENCTD